MSNQNDYFSHDGTAGIDQSSFADRGSLIFDPSYNVSYVSPTYDGSVTTIRMLPYFDKDLPDAPEIPYRGGPGFAKFSPWFMSYPFFKSIGVTSKVSLVVNDPYVNQVFDQNSNPICVLSNEIRRAIAHAKKNNGALPNGRALANGSTQIPHSWYGLIEGGQNSSAALPAMTSAVFVPALVYQHKSKKTSMFELPMGLGADDSLPIVELSGSMWTSSVSKNMNTPTPNYQGNPADFENAYVNGDPVSLAHGRFLHIFKKGTDPRSTGLGAGAQGSQYSQPTTGSDADKKAIGYDSFFSKTLPGYGPGAESSNFGASLAFPADHSAAWIPGKLRDMYVPLRRLVKAHPAAQQATFIAALFPAEILLYAWENHPQWITPELRAKANAQVGGGHQPQAPAPAVGGYATGPWTPTGPSAMGQWGPPAPAGGGFLPPAGMPPASLPPGFQYGAPAALGLTPPVAPPVAPPAAATANLPGWGAPSTAPAAPSQFANTTVPVPNVPTTGHFTNPGTPVPTAPAVQPDPVAASLAGGASDFTPPAAPPIPDAPAPVSAPTPPGNIDFLKTLAKQTAAK